MAEIGADQLLLDARDRVGVELHRVADRPVARVEDVAGLPMARLEVLEHDFKFGLGGFLVERQHRIDDTPHPPGEARR